MAANKKKVAYYYDDAVANYYYGPTHPMKPHRLALTHSLVLGYELYDHMECFRPHPAAFEDICKFHTEDYIKFLHKISPTNTGELVKEMQIHNVGFVGQYDCPVFEDIFPFCQLYSGGSIDGAVRLNTGRADVSINWSGGLHHAKKNEASGFCYVNDAVLAILEMLKRHPRVLYIDIDVHHGDGVQEAFYYTDRVMTVSFHKYGDFFPGTGELAEIGEKAGKYYSINVPLNDGIDDISYHTIFRPVIQSVMDTFRPGSIVLQCGSDSLSGDRLGCFNLTVKGHAECVQFVTSFNVPTLVVGGGGYTVKNVARCWAYETSVLVGKEVSNEIPFGDYWEYFGPSFQLHYAAQPMENKNSREALDKLRIEILENLRALQGAPSVQMAQMPPEVEIDEDSDDEGADVRESQKTKDRRVARQEEWYKDDNDNDTMHDD